MDDEARLEAEAVGAEAEGADGAEAEGTEADGIVADRTEAVPARSGFRHVPAALLTTLAGAGIAVTLMTGAWATPTGSGAADADVAAVAQQYTAPGDFTLKAVKREHFAVAVAAPSAAADPSSSAAPALPSGKVVPAGEAQAYAAGLVAAHGWKPQQFACLVQMWGRESGWNAHAGRTNGPYGIPQAYPGSKMAAAGGNWVDDARVQIRWGLGYVIGRYGTPCGAWTHWQTAHSY